MKQTFTLELDLPSDTSRVSELRLGEAIRRGYKEYFGQVLPNLFVSEKTVEQNHGTPESIEEKDLDLLTRASDSLNYYCTEINGDMNDGLAMEIDKYIEDNTRAKIE